MVALTLTGRSAQVEIFVTKYYISIDDCWDWLTLKFSSEIDNYKLNMETQNAKVHDAHMISESQWQSAFPHCGPLMAAQASPS
jgi:hypothetical protein